MADAIMLTLIILRKFKGLMVFNDTFISESHFKVFYLYNCSLLNHNKKIGRINCTHTDCKSITFTLLREIPILFSNSSQLQKKISIFVKNESSKNDSQ